MNGFKGETYDTAKKQKHSREVQSGYFFLVYKIE